MASADRLLQDASMTYGATDARAPEPPRVRPELDRIAALLALSLVLGVVIIGRIALPGVLNPGTGINTFFEQYRRHEPLFGALLAAFAIAVAVVARRTPPDDGGLDSAWAPYARLNGTHLAAMSVLILVAAAFGTTAVMHSLPLAMDEYVASFQAHIFAAGKLSATLPDEWRQFGWSLKPVFVAYDQRQSEWVAVYWPIYSAVRALFIMAGADRFMNPLMAAVSVPLVFACARRMWPEDKSRAWLAAVFLVSSTQFLFMSMTWYAMPAHLAITLLWTYLYLRSDRTGWILAPLVGFVALGLHNPFPHALFAAPFLLQLLATRRWRWIAYFGVIYVAAAAFWYWWGKEVTLPTAGSNPLALFEFPGPLMLAVQHLSLTVVLSWQTPLLAVLLVWSAVTWRALSATERCLAVGIISSFLFFILYPTTQGHGWGYRYTYPVLGSMALLGASAAHRMANVIGRVAMQRLLVASLAISALIQVPVRAWQIEGYVRPFARAHEYIAGLDADVVVVDPTTSWYGIDLVRNDPFLRARPVVVSAFGLRPIDKQALAARFGRRVHLLTAEELAPFGIPTYPSRFRNAVWP